jgi:importin subunit beta-1
VVAAIAAIELPNHQWQDLISTLITAVTSGDLNTRVATLQCIGFICETIVRANIWSSSSITLLPLPGSRYSQTPIERNLDRSCPRGSKR